MKPSDIGHGAELCYCLTTKQNDKNSVVHMCFMIGGHTTIMGGSGTAKGVMDNEPLTDKALPLCKDVKLVSKSSTQQ